MHSSIPVLSTPAGASHRLRVWLRIPCVDPGSSAPSRPTSPTPAYVYHRLWKSDDFKIGAHLDFEAVSVGHGHGHGNKLVLAARGPTHAAPASEDHATRTRTLMALLTSTHPHVSRVAPAPSTGIDEPGEPVHDR